MSPAEKFNWEDFVETDALDYIASLMGREFERAVNLTNKIIEDPTHYTGIQALGAAQRLSNFRFKIGAEAEKYKQLAQKSPTPPNKLIKGTLIMAYNAIEEMIMTLKALGRYEKDVVGSGT